jgi:putative ABC transport system substrate-binding protein
MRRREFIAGLGSAAGWSLTARAQQSAQPIVGFVSGASADDAARFLGNFRAGLTESAYVEGKNVRVEYRYLAGQYDHAQALLSDLVARRVAVIVTIPNPIAIAAKAVTSTTPIVFGIAEDPVKVGLVASLARPGGNATGLNFLNNEATSKRVGLLHELAPQARRLAVLVNPGNSPAMATASQVTEPAARLLGRPIEIFKAGTNREIEEAFEAMAAAQVKILFIEGDIYFTSRRAQLATLAARYGIITSYSVRDFAVAGGLMSYGTDLSDAYRQMGAYTGRILNGEKPADLPVQQATKFELVINLNTAKALGLTIPPNLLALADEVIE